MSYVDPADKPESSDRPVGIIGIGNMGSPLAESLLRAGRAVVGVDVDPEQMDWFTGAGGTAARHPADVVAAADIVILSLPSIEALNEVVHGPSGLLASPRPGVVIADTGTFPIPAKQAVRDALTAAGMEMLDCTVSGTGAQARNRDIVLYTSGPEEAVARCKAVFDIVARDAPRVGDFGAGSMMKFVANLLVTVNTVAAAEAITLAARCGLDPAEALRLISSGSGNSRILELRGPMMVARDYDHDSSTLESLAKDTEIILGFAGDHSCPVPMLATASTYLRSAMAQFPSHVDPAVVREVLGVMAGLEPLEGRQ
jgi:L-threonate 2-dehydrogenase